MAETKQVVVPDIGGFDAVEIIEILVAPGDPVDQDAPLITLESDKASMDIPAPFAGVVIELTCQVGDKIAQDGPILTMEVTSSDAPDAPEPEKQAPPAPAAAPTPVAVTPTPEVKAAPPAANVNVTPSGQAHASPSVRRFARELGVDLAQVTGSGRKQRILKQDVTAFVKQKLARGAQTGGALPTPPVVDFSVFGEIESKPLSRIKKISGAHLQSCWLNAPQVTQFDEADITDLEAFRQSMKGVAEKKGVKLTFLPFLMKAVVAVLQQFPDFNASLDPNGEALILKKYYNIGIAVDTPEGLMVPVVRAVEQKGLLALAADLMALSAKAREKKLMPGDLQGGCLTISSLGGIGGTAFTPIVNLPEVAILGVSRSAMKPVYDGQAFQPRLMLPLSLSYDHRVIDGAAGARFTRALSDVLTDMRRILL